MAPIRTLPAETGPAETLPAETLPAETLPAETGPGETGPGETAPTPAVPDLAWLADAAAARDRAGLNRRLHPRPAPAPPPRAASGSPARGVERPEVDLASNDYLGLARHPEVVAGAVQAVRTWGAGSTGSRLVTGSTELHAQLESALAAHAGAQAALVFSSGYLANLGVLPALAGPGALVVSDAYNHASIVDACRLSRARVAVVAHLDVAAVDRVLASGDEQRAVVVVDALFSVDGDLAPLAQLHATCRRHGALLVVDEAHSFGVVGAAGRGACVDAGLAGAPDLVITATLSKALGAQGGVVLAAADVVDHLVNTARTFVFDTALAPACAGAALAAVTVLQREPGRAGRVRERAGQLAAVAAGLGAPNRSPAGAITSVPVATPHAALAAAQACARAGVRVGCFRPPSVPDGVSRLRLAASADLEDGDIRRAADVLREALVGDPETAEKRPPE